MCPIPYAFLPVSAPPPCRSAHERMHTSLPVSSPSVPLGPPCLLSLTPPALSLTGTSSGLYTDERMSSSYPIATPRTGGMAGRRLCWLPLGAQHGRMYSVIRRAQAWEDKPGDVIAGGASGGLRVRAQQNEGWGRNDQAMCEGCRPGCQLVSG